MPITRLPLHPMVHRAVWGVLVLALVAAQALGQWHRVAHAPGMPGHAAAHAWETLAHQHGEDAHAEGSEVHHADDAPSWTARLFGADGHASACVLYDQLAHADGLTSLPVLWLPPVWVAALAPWEGRWQIAAQAVGFLARGPPRGA